MEVQMLLTALEMVEQDTGDHIPMRKLISDAYLYAEEPLTMTQRNLTLEQICSQDVCNDEVLISYVGDLVSGEATPIMVA